MSSGRAESRIASEVEVLAELQRHGHEVMVTEAWANGKVMGIHYDTAWGAS